MTTFVRLLFILLLLTACQGQNDDRDSGNGNGSDTPIEQPAPGEDDTADDTGNDTGNDSPSLPTTPNGSTIALPPGVASIDFALGTVRITTDDATHTLSAEIAATPEQRQRGLMFRTSMPEESGMIFVFEGNRTGGFWMYNTFLPLSIAYIAADGTIVTIRDMQPCAGRSQTVCSQEADAYVPSAPYRYALEVNQGYFDARDITVGDSVSYTTD